MRISDLQPQQNISLLVSVNGTSLTFESKVQENYPRKNMILADPIIRDGKPVSFRGKNIIVNLLASFKDEKPLLFKNVTTKLLKKSNGEFCYSFTTIADGIAYNRRENFRCYVGIYSSVQRVNSAAHNAMIRDVSYTGFAVVCDADFSAECGQLLHTVLNDQPKENGTVYNFHLYGLIARVQELDNGKILYGCQLTGPVRGLDKYIMEKERVRLKSTNGGNL